MRLLDVTILSALMLCSVGAMADRDHKKHKEDVSRYHEHKQDKHGHDEDQQGRESHHKKSLPHGLKKKLERTGELPPGWQKKVREGDVLDERVYAKKVVIKPVDKEGNELIRVEDKVFKIYQKTREVREIIDVVKALDE